MHWWGLASEAGKLFVFPSPQVADFQMKNTVLPLLNIFIRKEGAVDSIAENAAPYRVANIYTADPVIALVEVPAGTVIVPSVP